MQLASLAELPEMLLRLGFATAIGAAIGIDRDLHHKPAGIRVLSMVSMASAVAVMASLSFVDNPDAGTRTMQGILSGIGFLGAGVILHGQGRNEVHGLATAASIWVAAVLGIVCGLGNWVLAVTASTAMMLILVAGRKVEQKLQAIRDQKESPPS